MVTRSPVRIGNFKVEASEYSVDGLLEVVTRSVKNVFDRLDESVELGILLSGGIDSTILVMLAREFYPNIPCFTIGSAYHHPDVVASAKLAEEFGLRLYTYFPSQKHIKIAREKIKTHLKGDESVFLALEFAATQINSILATDGIDEQMGGYWWHTHHSSRFTTQGVTFENFWNQLEIAHLTPMYESAKQVGINISWVFLTDEVVEYVSRIPLADRVAKGVGKVIWRELAKMIGVPDWVIERNKLGFSDALLGE